jgi:hypothetical protein
MTKDEFLKRHEAEHARVTRLKKAKGNVARDYWINVEMQPFDTQWERERRQQETEEFIYKELLRFVQRQEENNDDNEP